MDRRLRVPRVVCAAALLAWPTIAAGQRASHTALLTYLRVGNERVVFEEDTVVDNGSRHALPRTSFRDAAQRIGPARLMHRGESGESFSWQCFRLDGSPSLSLVLEGNEMSVGDIGGFEIIPTGSRPELESDCTKVGARSSDLQTDRGVRLGLSRAEVTARLGVDGRDSADVVVFEQILKKRARNSPGTSCRTIRRRMWSCAFVKTMSSVSKAGEWRRHRHLRARRVSAVC
jgi:hypothetical protein